MTTRRDFIRQATLLGAGLSMSPFFINATPGSVGANDKIRVGLIGCKGMGFSDLQAFLRIRKSSVSHYATSTTKFSTVARLKLKKSQARKLKTYIKTGGN